MVLELVHHILYASDPSSLSFNLQPFTLHSSQSKHFLSQHLIVFMCYNESYLCFSFPSNFLTLHSASRLFAFCQNSDRHHFQSSSALVYPLMQRLHTKCNFDFSLEITSFSQELLVSFHELIGVFTQRAELMEPWLCVIDFVTSLESNLEMSLQ